jgi:hypothetical protein
MPNPIPKAASQRPPLRGAVLLAATALFLIAMYALSVFRGPERRAIGELPEAERKALFERTLKTLKTTCAPETRPAGLNEHCARQADLIVKFPECDADCAAVANASRPPPTR